MAFEKNDFVEEGDDVDGEGKNPIGEEFNHEEEFSADQGNDQGRILEEDTNIIYCTFDTPIIKGKYEVDVESVSSSEVDLSEASLSFDIEFIDFLMNIFAFDISFIANIFFVFLCITLQTRPKPPFPIAYIILK